MSERFADICAELAFSTDAVVALVVLGALLAGTLPNSPASAVHDAIAGWHWVAHHVQAQWQRDALQDRDVQTHSGRG